MCEQQIEVRRPCNYLYKLYWRNPICLRLHIIHSTMHWILKVNIDNNVHTNICPNSKHLYYIQLCVTVIANKIKKCHEKSSNVIKCHQHSHQVSVIKCHEMSFNLTWWHLMTNGDIWWHFVTFHDIWWHFGLKSRHLSWYVMTFHDMSWYDPFWFREVVY